MLLQFFKEEGCIPESGEDPVVLDGQEEKRRLFPSELGDFRLLGKIGEGGMSEVYDAVQITLNRRVALKLLPRPLCLSKRALNRLRMEAQTIALLDHPGIVKVIIMDPEEGFIAQELVEGGETLTGLIERKPRDDRETKDYFQRMAGIIMQAAEALQHAHDRGIIHRDVKPSNILITRDGSPKISDFGLARVDGVRHSWSRDFCGTVFYMSPEQVSGRRSRIDQRTDIFSLGATLYETLALKRPFPGESSQEVLKKVVECNPVELRRIDRRIPYELSSICGRAMDKNPDRRYRSMAEFAEDLRRYLAGEPLSPETIGWLRRANRWIRRHKIIVAAAMVLFAAVVVLAWHAYYRAKNAFLPVPNAYAWADYHSSFDGMLWQPHIDPGDPCLLFYEILRDLEMTEDIDSSLFEKIDSRLRELLVRCRERGEVRLIEDALYLQAYLKRREAEKNHDPQWLHESDEIYSDLGFFNPFSPDAFIWRADLEEAAERGLLVNHDHFLIHLSTVQNLASGLYKGGHLKDFLSAKEHLLKVLEQRPKNRSGLLLLGRLEFFQARSFRQFAGLEDAEKTLLRALHDPGPDPCGMIYTTLGQIRQLIGDQAGALEWFNSAVTESQDPYYLHNALCGLGRAYMYMGDRSSCIDYLIRANEEVKGSDPHVHLALAEYYLFLGDWNRARDHADQALKLQLASSYFMLARISTATGDREGAIWEITCMRNEAEYCPRDFLLACIFLASLDYSVETGKDVSFKEKRAVLLAELMNDLRHDASETCLYFSARGAC
ncbi:MAG: protein kinase, partial [Planctomycetota bacterium]